jgi:hypothetical protein
MKQVDRKIMVAVAIATAITVSGCETTGGAQENVAGAGIGALVGCGIGALIKGSRGCAVGAGIGAAAGLAYVAIKHYEARRTGPVIGATTTVTSPKVTIDESTNSPRMVRAGQTLDVTTDYSLRLPPGESSASVTEAWVLKQNGRTVYALPKQTNNRTEGIWEAEAEISVPDGAAPGAYVIEHRVQAGSSYDTRSSKFTVKA